MVKRTQKGNIYKKCLLSKKIVKPISVILSGIFLVGLELGLGLVTHVQFFYSNKHVGVAHCGQFESLSTILFGRCSDDLYSLVLLIQKFPVRTRFGVSFDLYPLFFFSTPNAFTTFQQ